MDITGNKILISLVSADFLSCYTSKIGCMCLFFIFCKMHYLLCSPTFSEGWNQYLYSNLFSTLDLFDSLK